MIILVAGSLGFLIALAGSPGIGFRRGEVVYVSVVAANQEPETPE